MGVSRVKFLPHKSSKSIVSPKLSQSARKKWHFCRSPRVRVWRTPKICETSRLGSLLFPTNLVRELVRQPFQLKKSCAHLIRDGTTFRSTGVANSACVFCGFCTFLRVNACQSVLRTPKCFFARAKMFFARAKMFFAHAKMFFARTKMCLARIYPKQTNSDLISAEIVFWISGITRTSKFNFVVVVIKTFPN